jgi:hypothetical protein
MLQPPAIFFSGLEDKNRSFLLSNCSAKEARVTMSLQIIKVNLCGVFVLFIAHKLPDQLAPELCKSGRLTLSSDPPRHRFLLPLVLRTGT